MFRLLRDLRTEMVLDDYTDDDDGDDNGNAEDENDDNNNDVLLSICNLRMKLRGFSFWLVHWH